MKTVVCISDGYYSEFLGVLQVPDEINLDTEKAAWNKWYHEEYCPDSNFPKHVIYHSLLDHLLEKGCQKLKVETWEI